MSISYDEYKNIIEKEESELLKESPVWCDFPIDNLYEHGYQIEFVHKSIFEYFTALYIFNLLTEILILSQDNNKIIECGKRLCLILSNNLISNEMLAYLKCIMLHSKYNDTRYYCNYTDIFIKILLAGIQYFVPYEEHKIVFSLTQYVFANLLQILHSWDLSSNALYDLHNNDTFIHNNDTFIHSLMNFFGLTTTSKVYTSGDNFFSSIIQFNHQYYDSSFYNILVKCLLYYYLSLPKNKVAYNFSFMNLEHIWLERANLINCDFTNSNLKESNMNYANLSNSNLENAILTGASFHQADLRGANLTGAVYTTELDDAILD